jgi:hypothetical protein
VFFRIAARLLFGQAASRFCFFTAAQFQCQPVELLLEAPLQLFGLAQRKLFFVAEPLLFRRPERLGFCIATCLLQSFPALLFFGFEARTLISLATALFFQKFCLLFCLPPLLFFSVAALLRQRLKAVLAFGGAAFALLGQIAADPRFIFGASLLVGIESGLDLTFLALLLRAVDEGGEERIVTGLAARGLKRDRLRGRSSGKLNGLARGRGLRRSKGNAKGSCGHA